MAELDKTKPSGTDTDLAELEWGTGLTPPTAEIITPSPSKRSDGWVDGEAPTFEFFNWFWRLVALVTTWSAVWKIRSYSDLESALDVTVQTPLEDGHIFMVGRVSGFTQPFSVEWSVVGAAASDVLSVTTDAQFVYYIQGQTVLRANRATGADITSRDLGIALNRVHADGFGVVAVSQLNGGSEVHALDRLTLADLAGFPKGGSGVNVIDVSSNGDQFAVAESAANTAQLYTYTAPSASVNALDDILRVAIDYGAIFTASVGPGIEIKGWTLGASLLWTVAFPAPGVEVADMVSDGDQLFVVTPAFPVSGVNANVMSFDRDTGALNWRTGAPDNTTVLDATSVCVDDMWVYVAAGDFVFQLDKRTGATVRRFDHGATVLSLVCDGDSVFLAGEAGTGGFRMRRLNRGNGTKMFIKALGTDPNRRPFPTLAIPYERGR